MLITRYYSIAMWYYDLSLVTFQYSLKPCCSWVESGQKCWICLDKSPLAPLPPLFNSVHTPIRDYPFYEHGLTFFVSFQIHTQRSFQTPDNLFHTVYFGLEPIYSSWGMHCQPLKCWKQEDEHESSLTTK